MNNPSVVARTVARIRDGQAISQSELADLMENAGFASSRDHIMNWERGRVDITICELAEVLRICNTHRVEFVPKAPTPLSAPAYNGEPVQPAKRGLSCKVTVTVEFDDDPNKQPNQKKKFVYRVRKRRGSS
jgi:transcriptional regulator with XRE-family HTH domain